MDSQPNACINGEQYAAAYIYPVLYEYILFTRAAHQNIQTNQYAQGTI